MNQGTGENDAEPGSRGALCRLTHDRGSEGAQTRSGCRPKPGDPSLPQTRAGKDSRFREPKKRFLPWALLAQLFQDPPTVEKGLCECSAGPAPPQRCPPVLQRKAGEG